MSVFERFKTYKCCV